MEIEVRECKNHGKTEFRSTIQAGRKNKRWICRECSKEFSSKHYLSSEKTRKTTREGSKLRKKRLKQFIWDYYLAHPCVNCGESDPVVLEFDHIDGATKSFGISEAIYSKSFKKVEAEIAKCQILCANCHKRKTAITLNWYHDVVKEGTKSYL